MSISDAKAVFGLTAIGTPTSTNTTGSVQIGPPQTTVRFSDADVAYSLRIILAQTGDAASLSLADGDTSGSDAWVAGTAQVETATIVAAGGCTSNGTMTLVLTSAGMTGSPLNVDVALTTVDHTTAALIATAARTALSAVAVVAARFTVGGTGADITLTRLPDQTITVGTTDVNILPATDATLNLAIPSGLGVTAAASSANTTSGVASSGAYIFDGDGKDFEGNSLTSIGSSLVNAILMTAQAGGVDTTGTLTGLVRIMKNTVFLLFRPITASEGMSLETFTLTSIDGVSDVSITILGQS